MVIAVCSNGKIFQQPASVKTLCGPRAPQDNQNSGGISLSSPSCNVVGGICSYLSYKIPPMEVKKGADREALDMLQQIT